MTVADLPNTKGILTILKEAERYCEYSNHEELGIEDVLWLP